MITSWNPYAVSAFEAAFRPWMRRRIPHRYVRGTFGALEDRVILAANHVSWWDGFLLRELHRPVSPDPLFTLMRADRLARFPIFAKMGVLGLSDDPSMVLHAVRRLGAVRRPFWLSYFPQGRIWPSFKRPLGFRRGLELFSRELAPCSVVPIGLHLEPMTEPGASAFIGIGSPHRVLPGRRVGASDVEADVAAILDAMVGVLSEAGEDAGAAWSSNRPPSAS